MITLSVNFDIFSTSDITINLILIPNVSYNSGELLECTGVCFSAEYCDSSQYSKWKL